jgi:hypothetical protein
VLDAAGVLDMREVDFFRLAFRRWFGRDIRDSEVERVFAAYMFRNIVPPWTRHFARHVLARATEGRLDAAELGALKYTRPPPAPRHGRIYVGITAALMVLYFLGMVNASYDPGTSAPMPCQGGPGFRFISDMAYAVSGKEPPSCEAVKALR